MGWGDWKTDVLQAEQRKSFQEEGVGKRGKRRGARGLRRGLRIGSHTETQGGHGGLTRALLVER